MINRPSDFPGRGQHGRAPRGWVHENFGKAGELGVTQGGKDRHVIEGAKSRHLLQFMDLGHLLLGGQMKLLKKKSLVN